MKRLFDAGFAKGVEDASVSRWRRRPSIGQRPDGSPIGKRSRSTASARRARLEAQAPSVRRRHGVAHDVGPRADGKAGQVSASAYFASSAGG